MKIPQHFLRKENRPLVIAHRGASALAPENTLASFLKAVELGADLIEFDVQLTSDLVPVVFHDEGLERTADQWGDLASTPFDELRQCDAGKWFSSSFKGEKVPTLVETLDCVGKKALLYVELKRQKKAGDVLVRKTIEMIQSKGLAERAILVSFDFTLIELVKKSNPSLLTGVNFITPEKVTKWVNDSPEQVDFLCPRFSLLNDSFLQFTVEKQKPIYAWNSDDPQILKKWGDLPQIHAVATNNPEFFFSVYPR